jgi:hypothetical protein
MKLHQGLVLRSASPNLSSCDWLVSLPSCVCECHLTLYKTRDVAPICPEIERSLSSVVVTKKVKIRSETTITELQM